jgi:hypothetical protein
MDLLDGRRNLLLDLDMEGDRVATRLDELVDEPAGLADHQVCVERQLRPRSDALDHLRTECQVRDEVPVHDVEMDPIGPFALRPADGVGHVRVVRVEDARSDPRPPCAHP